MYNSDLTFLKVKGNSHDYNTKGFSKTCMIHSRSLLDKKLHLHNSGSLRSEFQVLVCLLFIGRHFLFKGNDQTFYLFISKAHKEQGILLFVHWK